MAEFYFIFYFFEFFEFKPKKLLFLKKLTGFSSFIPVLSGTWTGFEERSGRMGRKGPGLGQVTRVLHRFGSGLPVFFRA
jgi:hypothetical protein